MLAQLAIGAAKIIDSSLYSNTKSLIIKYSSAKRKGWGRGKAACILICIQRTRKVAFAVIFQSFCIFRLDWKSLWLVSCLLIS